MAAGSERLLRCDCCGDIIGRVDENGRVVVFGKHHGQHHQTVLMTKPLDKLPPGVVHKKQ